MDAFESKFAAMLKKIIAEEVATKTEHLVAGRAKTLDDYAAKAAHIQAMMTVTKWCDEIRAELTKQQFR